ncbi:MAG: serine/threonine-protein kinase [Planctomycetota bacterium]|jgi:tRNA A-37 threonylcarbamoyl transferase component Bud32
MPDLDREERLASVLDSLAARQQAGHDVDWPQLRERHPDLVDEVRQLLAVGQIVDGLVRSDTPTVQSRPPFTAADAPLPRPFDRFQLVEELGRGGMGVVYKAWDPELQRHVALKMILRGAHASAEDLARFRQEAKASAGLTHPNIVPVYQVGDAGGQAFFCLKFIPGPTLAQLVAAGPLPQREAAAILSAIARAVQHAHERGVLHRDLKPSNVLLDEQHHPLVTDFGLAKRFFADASVAGGGSGGITGTGAILGTPSYMAPEQADASGSSSPASDIYSLGAILYELLTGRPPFLASSPVDTLLLVRSEEPVRPKLLNPNIDLDLELICRKCLEKSPAHRYVSASALADDLDAFLSGEPVSARTSSVVYLVTRFFRDTHNAPVLENWGLLWMWHSLALLLLCVVTGGLYAAGVDGHLTYLLLWSIGLVVWGTAFWNLRRRSGPVTFVEREIAHAWAAGVIASIAVFVIEVLLGLPVLTLTPILAVVAGMIFLVKAGTLSGGFYLAAIASFLIAAPMAIVGPPWSPVLFGLVSALSFFIPGLKYYRQLKRRDP